MRRGHRRQTALTDCAGAIKREALSMLEEGGAEEQLIGGNFVVERQRIGPGSGRHTPKTDRSAGKVRFDRLANLGCCGMKNCRQGLCGFTSGTADIMAQRDLLQ